MNATRLFTIAFALALLAGCGNKGPLVLPTQPAPIDPATAPDAPAEDASQDDAPLETTESDEDGSTLPEEPVDVPATSDDDGNG